MALLGRVDSGADMTVLPEELAEALALPAIGSLPVTGPGWRGRTRVFAARVEAAGESHLLEVLAMGSETLVGRDLLNRWQVLLDGPAGVLEITPAGPARP